MCRQGLSAQTLGDTVGSWADLSPELEVKSRWLIMRSETAVRAGNVALLSLLMLSCDVVDRTEPSIVITHVTVIDATGRPPMADMTVVIAGGRIQRIAAADTVSPIPGTEEVDGSGKYLIPGLWDMHVH